MDIPADLANPIPGWDATLAIPDEEVDPFGHVSDDELLYANAGVVAAIASAQSNQMLVLDSAIVPDRDLVAPTANPAQRFNEFPVYTPEGAAERYAVINENGEEEVVVPSDPYFPGLAERDDGAPHPLTFRLGEYSGDPYAVSFACAAALLQIGVESNHEVAPMSLVLSRVWGQAGLFSPGTLAGFSGTSEIAAMFSLDRGTNARRLASWQNRTLVRSGQLTMTRGDWGPLVHCDFRRIRVAAEALFAASLSVESGQTQATGRIVYHVPSTTMLSADPAYLFPSAVSPELIPMQPMVEAARDLLARASEVGVIAALWPARDPVIADTWATTLQQQAGLSAARVTYATGAPAGGTVVSRATRAVARFTTSIAGARGRTAMTAVSARISAMAESAADVGTIAWIARFAACVECMALATSKPQRTEMARHAWPVLRSGQARLLETHTSDHAFVDMYRTLPAELRALCSVRSARCLVWSVLMDVTSPKHARGHTVLRAVRRSLARSENLARVGAIAGRMYDAAANPATWLSSRIGVLREFWACQYGALASTVGVVTCLRNDVRWWHSIAVAVNTFRAGVMRSISVSSELKGRRGSVEIAGLELYMVPYHAAARFKRVLSEVFPVPLPEFTHRSYIAEWLDDVSVVVSPIMQERARDQPRSLPVRALADNTSFYSRGCSLLMDYGALSAWVERTFAHVAADVTTVIAQAQAAREGPGREQRAMAADIASAAMAEAYTEAAENISAAMEAITQGVPTGEFYETGMDAFNDDAWDEFVEAAEVTTHPLHAECAMQMSALRAAPTADAALAIAAWGNAAFNEGEEDAGERITG